MIVPYLRQDLEVFRGNSREDGSPAWLLYDAIRNKYFTLGLTAFKLIKNWSGGEDIKNFEKKRVAIFFCPNFGMIPAGAKILEYHDKLANGLFVFSNLIALNEN